LDDRTEQGRYTSFCVSLIVLKTTGCHWLLFSMLRAKASLRCVDCLAIAMRIAGMSPADQTASRKLTQAFLLITGLTWQGTE